MLERKFKATMDNFLAGGATKEKLYQLIDEAKLAFQEIRMQMESDDPEVREDAVLYAIEIKQSLESKLIEIAKKTGMRPEDLLAISDNPQKLSRDERETLETAKSKIESPINPAPAPKRSLKSRKLFA